MLDLKKVGKERVLIAAHRGTNGGNIVQNTLPAFKNALLQHSDIVEIDVIKSVDNQYFVFHDGQEEMVFKEKIDIRTLTSDEILSLKMRNISGEFIHQKVEKLDHIISFLANKCIINIDRSWFYWDTFLDYLKKCEFKDSILLKAPAERKYLDQLVNSQLNIQFMPIVTTMEQLKLVWEYDALNIVAIELVFNSMENPLVSDTVLNQIRLKNKLLWCNAITLNDDVKLSAGFDDDLSITSENFLGWEKLIDMGFDIIQTDWPLLLYTYCLSKNKEK